MLSSKPSIVTIKTAGELYEWPLPTKFKLEVEFRSPFPEAAEDWWNHRIQRRLIFSVNGFHQSVVLFRDTNWMASHR